MRADISANPRWQRVSEVIADRTGLHFPPERHADLQRGLSEAAPELGFGDCESCVEWLLAGRPSTEQVRRLAGHLTVGETYFFRERPSFNALAAHVLPVLIRQRAESRRLRLWSAACSTGEEAYSLAILLQQALPDWRDWDLSILATDINPGALHKAQAGIYGEWSFRDCAPGFRENFFSPAGDRRYRVRSELREMVRFAELNLAQDEFPVVDLILCRNLLIYFTPDHARRLAAKLRTALMEGGWLVVSPAECSQALFQGFVPVNFPGSVFYRKREADPALSSPLPLTGLEVVQVLATGSTEAARVSTPKPEVEPETHKVEKLRTRARQLANEGDLTAALEASERWIAADKLDAAAHYFVAMVLQELGERARARAALHRAIYLLPEFVLAHFALGNHARAEARHAEARRHFANAGRLLRGRPADEPVPESDGLTAGRLREIIDALAHDV